MKIRVQAKGGAFEFDSAPGEPLLYAGLRNGLSLPYECGTGTCGTCRARVHHGDVDLLWPDAPGLSYVRREKNETLMCQAAARDGCTLRVPAVVGDEIGTVPPPRHRTGEVTLRQTLTDDVVAFQVAIDTPMTFDAGQFVVLETDALAGRRAYSMVNFGAAADRLDFVVKRKPGGGFSRWLFDTDVVGETLRVFGPLGRATFDPREDKNLLCIAGGSGIAGMMSITARADQEGYFKDHRGHVYFGVRTGEEVFYLDELAALKTRFPDTFEVTVALSDAEPAQDLRDAYPQIEFATGFVHAVASAHMAGRYDDLIAYVAGPPPMVDGALRMLILEARLPGSDIRYDKFG